MTWGFAPVNRGVLFGRIALSDVPSEETFPGHPGGPFPEGVRMRRSAGTVLAVLGLMALTAAPSQAAGPTFFFEKGNDAVSFWLLGTATERTTTAIIFFTADRGSSPGDHTTTFLSYFTLTETWDGAQWQPVSSTFALAHSDNGDVISFAIGPASRTISASATAEAFQCTPLFPNCTPLGSVQLRASWVATGPNDGPPGHHVTNWSGSGCDIDFRSGRTISLPASATATINDLAPAGDPFLAQIESFQGAEINFCHPGT